MQREKSNLQQNIKHEMEKEKQIMIEKKKVQGELQNAQNKIQMRESQVDEFTKQLDILNADVINVMNKLFHVSPRTSLSVRMKIELYL